MNYRYYTTRQPKKKPMYNSSLKWIINQISWLEIQLKNKELDVDDSLITDLRKVMSEFNQTTNELIYKN